jgi:citrate synthase
MGSVVAGSSEAAGRFLVDVLAAGRESGDLEAAAKSALEGLKAARRKVPGLGHPQHSAGDPRADRLLEVAVELGIAGDHIRTLHLLAEHAPGIVGRPLPINVSGAIPAVMLDAGWPAEAMKAIPLVARAAGLAAHLYEETQRSIGFIMSHRADQAITYDGKSAVGGA